MGCNWSMCQNLNTWDVFWMNQIKMKFSRKVASQRRVAGAITSLVNDSDLQLECAKSLA